MTCPERYRSKLYWWEKNPYRCAKDIEPCSLWRLGWCRRFIHLLVLILSAGLYFGIGLARAYEATQNRIVTFGPADWREKKADCERRAKLLGGAWIIPVEDDRYCVVKK